MTRYKRIVKALDETSHRLTVTIHKADTPQDLKQLALDDRMAIEHMKLSWLAIAQGSVLDTCPYCDGEGEGLEETIDMKNVRKLRSQGMDGLDAEKASVIHSEITPCEDCNGTGEMYSTV